MAKSSSFNKDTQQALRELKQQLKAAPVTSSGKITPSKTASGKVTEETPDDEKLFAQAMRGVKPIKTDETPVPAPAKPKKPSAQILARRAAAVGVDEAGMQGISDTQAMLNPVASEAVLSYRLATLQHRIFEQLKAGKLRWYEAVDLHGCTIEEARSAVLQIIEIARQANENVIKIVHGKGPQAILKTYVNGWLRQHREVLAFVSAPSEQGGTGAVLVLIKRAERQSSDDKANHSKPKTR
ncbi:Smr/MutS family protein [Alkanindiges illinoisensis]|uniref:DNA mismatch repair protein MutS n=1 Tax=Alkanindiges illinoisensis TaxID=197183 RepID=A0A4Y7XDS5_9GAMM|nr:Smr/MutS family protein [Alkanindiges illinoisensis]TEU27256.1 DNA mismatch repair protein MutS [Alkanindiges illinoisensis]